MALRPARLDGSRFPLAMMLWLLLVVSAALGAAVGGSVLRAPSAAVASEAPSPLLAQGRAVDWWFIFKFNAGAFPRCGDAAERQCPFGGEVKDYGFSQQFVYASSANPTLQKGGGCVGATSMDPLGATFAAVYDSDLYYVIWNDQFYGDPAIVGCGDSCSAPWGHSKGMLAWDEAGEGFVLQVTTPSWPAAGSNRFPRRTDGNTLGCIKDDDVKFSQHFFALRLTKDDLLVVLNALKNASVATNPHDHQLANIGGPQEIQLLVASLGGKSTSKSATKGTLTSGVILISKPSRLNVPPWQMVSSLLGGISLRAATWWTTPAIPSTTTATAVSCWDASLNPRPGAVEIAMTGQWSGTVIGLKGGNNPAGNHAKVGVSTSGIKRYAIFGDMNQQGALSGNCASSQNGRGGLFFVVENTVLADSVANLIRGATAPTAPAPQ